MKLLFIASKFYLMKRYYMNTSSTNLLELICFTVPSPCKRSKLPILEENKTSYYPKFMGVLMKI